MHIPYLEHFALIDEPYSTSPNPRYLYISPTHNLALEKTKWTIAARRGLAICFGAVGTGKTTIARELAARLEDDPTVSYVSITNPNFPTAVNQITVFTFDPGTGAMKKLQSYSQPSSPGGVVVITR